MDLVNARLIRFGRTEALVTDCLNQFFRSNLMGVSMNMLRVLIATSALAFVTPANASVIVDGSPTGTYRGSWSNQTNGQNFLVRFTLSGLTNVNGLDIFAGPQFALLGEGVRVRIRSDAGGLPSASNLFSFDDVIDTITPFDSNSVIAGTDFAPISLAAGSYWFGVSGLTDELSWHSYNNGGPATNPNQRQLGGETVVSTPGVHDFAFRIRGVTNPGAVPEPATWAMLLLGFGLLGGALRYGRRTTKVAFG
jgi:PEP-CTERM motif